jgi:hypothetical protein
LNQRSHRGEAASGQWSIYICSDLAGASYQSFIDHACKACKYFSVVVRTDFRYNASMSVLLEKLRPNLFKEFETRRVPSGEIHSAHPPVLKVYTTTPRSIRPVLKSVGSLAGWLPPGHPEDLCFYRADRSLAMVSTSHEREAIFFDQNLIRPYLDELRWSELDLGEESRLNPFKTH